MNHSPNLVREEAANPVLDELIAEITDKLQAGQVVDVEMYAAAHPEAAVEIRRLLPALEMLAVAGNPPRSEAASDEASREPRLRGELGDFRVLREVGRGGMGVVYEAEQISLRRRVALKVLPFAATMDARNLQRFHNEAQAAACLHHTKIVPVFSVGCERGVHFYAMQFIDGQPLSDLIRQLRATEKKTPVPGEERTVVYQPAPGDAPTPRPAAEMTPLTGQERRGRDYFRKVAEMGVQAAEALDHAHQLGIVHRDIKPGNLLVDSRGNLWVTDFGLAHIQHGETNLTVTGQALGTPRYMSPEQALAQRAPLDHRTDVYSLGVTLYELLTLRPAFVGEDRQELLRQIADAEPARPRRLERAIPAELEVIVLKAMEKRPQDRYATAQELADDLRRWLLDQPIRARRPSWLQVARKWGRRHQAVIWAGVAVGIMAVAALAISTGLISAAYQEESKHRKLAEEAEGRETLQRQAAERERDTKADQLYIADMQRAQQAWEAGNIDRLQELLEAHRPGPDQRDRRGWEWYYLQGVSHSALHTLQTGYYRIQSLVWSPDGRQLAAAGANEKRIQIWNVATGEHRVIVSDPQWNTPKFPAWSPDGRRLAWADRDEGIIIWDVVKNREDRVFPGFVLPGYPNVGWSPDGRQLTAITTRLDGNQITRWEVGSGKECGTLDLGKWDYFKFLALSPDSKYLACVQHEFRQRRDRVIIWETAIGKQLLDFTTDQGVSKVVWSPDSTRLALGYPHTVKIHRATDGKELLTLPGHSSPTWSPGGHRLAAPSVAMPQALKVWDGTTGKELGTFRGHAHPVILAAWSPDGKRLASATTETIKVWDATREQGYAVLKSGPGLVDSLDWHPDGKRLAVSCTGATTQIWEPPSERPARTINTDQSPSGSQFVWSPDGQMFVSQGDAKKSIVIRSADGAKVVHTLMPTRKAGSNGFFTIIGAFAWDPNSHRLAFGFQDGSVRVWNVTEEREVCSLSPGGSPETLAWSPDRRWLAVKAIQSTLVYDTATWQRPLLLIRDSNYLNPHAGLAWSPDSRLLAAADGTNIKILDLSTQKETRRLRGHASEIEGLSWSPDGRRLVSAGQDHTVKLWELTTGQEVLTLHDAARCVRWSPDGRRLAAAAAMDGRVKLWDASPGQQVEKPVRPTSIGPQMELASKQDSLALLLQRMGRYPEAETAYRQAIELREGVIAHFPYESYYRTQAMHSRSRLANYLAGAGRYAETEAAYRQLLTLQEGLCRDFPHRDISLTQNDYITWVGGTYRRLGQLFVHLHRFSEAVECYRQSLATWPEGVFSSEKEETQNDLAWLLATCPDPAYRIPAEAVELGKKAVQLYPEKGGYWNTLGVAQYRSGDGKSAIASLTKSVEIRQGGDSFDFFFLAMTHGQLGQKEKAREWYAKAVQWMDRNRPQDEELQRFRAEAAALLSIADAPKPNRKEGSPDQD